MELAEIISVTPKYRVLQKDGLNLQSHTIWKWLHLFKTLCKLAGEHFTEPQTTVQCILNIQKVTCPLFFLLDLGLRYWDHSSWVLSRFVTCAVFTDGFLGLCFTWETVLIWKRERDDKKTLIEREIQQGHAGRGINSPPTPPNTTDLLICRAPAVGFPGGLRTMQGLARRVTSFIFPAGSPVFCKFCSYTADRSILWFAFSGEVGTASGSSYF